MPTYEYQCKACDEHLEAVQSFHDAPLTTCPSCGGELRKVFGKVGIVFKGSGFYKTDSRSSTTGSAGSASPKAPAGGEASAPASAPASTEPAASTKSTEPSSGGSSSSSGPTTTTAAAAG